MSKAELTRNQKKEWAQLLYLTDQYTQKEIAAKVDVAEKTISQWVTKEGWDNLRKSMLVTRNEMLSFLYNVLAGISDQMKESKDYADTKKADAIVKYTAAIKNLETETNTAQKMEVGRMFINYLIPIDPQFALSVTNHLDAFIKAGLKKF